MQAYKPGSVHHLSDVLIIYLALPSPARSINLPIPLPRKRREASSLDRRNLFGLSTRKVYPASSVATGAVSSYLAFSPFPQIEVVCFLWHFLSSHPKVGSLPVRKYGALRCPDFPLRSFVERSDKTACILVQNYGIKCRKEKQCSSKGNEENSFKF